MLEYVKLCPCMTSKVCATGLVVVVVVVFQFSLRYCCQSTSTLRFHTSWFPGGCGWLVRSLQNCQKREYVPLLWPTDHNGCLFFFTLQELFWMSTFFVRWQIMFSPMLGFWGVFGIFLFVRYYYTYYYYYYYYCYYIGPSCIAQGYQLQYVDCCFPS